MGMKVTFNARQLEAAIENIADAAAKGASASMRKAAVKIRDLAREYAPFKTGALENAINYETVKGARNRNVFVVYIDMDAAASKGRNVGDYAWIMEEELHPYGRQRGKIHFDLGDGSNMKILMTGKKVGGRFLSRAVKEGSQEVFANALSAVARVLRNGRLVNIDYQREPGGNSES